MELSFVIILFMCSLVPNSVQRSISANDNRPPHGCDWIKSNPEELSCWLRTIGGVELLLNNLTQMQMSKLKSIKLSCSDVLFFDNSLDETRQSVFWSSLDQLRSLNIQFCKIRHIPEFILSKFRELHHLSFRSHNIGMSLEIVANSFRGLGELRTLDLGSNNIWNLPQGLFNPLYALLALNLTDNKLHDVTDLGFGDETQTAVLEILDLSFNNIMSIPDGVFSGLKELRVLMLQENTISMIGDRAFQGLNELRTLNLSSNLIVALPPELFQGSKFLSSIYLNNNSLNVLAPGLFTGLEQLEILDLSNNQLTSQWINRDTFAGLVRLIVLNLAENKLTKIDGAVFRELSTLQVLKLESNDIEFLNGAFTEMKNLHTLILTNNKLAKIEAKLLSGLYVLHTLHLDGNLIQEVHEQAFENLTNLQDLMLADNKLETVPEAICKLPSLNTLDLGKNNLKILTNQSFVGLDKLFGLRLTDNHIENITRDAFSPLKSLQVLNIASNKIRYVEQSAFLGNPVLSIIRLDENFITDISGVFTSLHSLVWLNISNNQLSWFDFSHLPKNLEWLDIHNNEITILGNYYEVSNLLKLKMLDASFNQLTKLDRLSIPDSIEDVLLNNNKIKIVSAGTFLNKYRLQKVILYGNEIENMDLAALALTPIATDRDLPQFYIGNNSFYCDCNMEWLLRINQLARLRQYPRVMDLDTIECTLPHARGSGPQKLTDLSLSQFLCRYETHCYATCHCCDFDACDCEMTCPENSTCYYDMTWTVNVVDCSNAGYNHVPEHIPMDATEIFLDGNDLGDLGSHVFIGKKKLQNLYLNNSNIITIHNRTFTSAKSLRILHLESNKLTEIRGNEFDELTNLNELYLDNNYISTIGYQIFKSMPNLKILRLNDNRIVNFQPLFARKSLEISFDGNLYTCDCPSILKLNVAEYLDKQFCMDSEEAVSDAFRRCEEEFNNAAVAISVIQRELNESNKKFSNSQFTPVIATTLVALIIVCLIMSIVYLFRQSIYLCLHSHYGVRLCGNYVGSIDVEEDGDRLYDGYIIYSLRDDEAVSNVIAPELEHLGYSVCLHHRDLHLVPGASYLSDSLLGAADASRRLILVISTSFITYEWSRPELRTALLASLRAPRRQYKLVCILLEGVLPPIMEAEIRPFLNSASSIIWSDRRFWAKLRYTMPSVRPSTLSRKKQRPNAEIRCKPGLGASNCARYTAAPTTLDTWSHFHNTCETGASTTPVHGVSTPRGTLTPSSCHEGDKSRDSSGQHYECTEHGYLALSYPHVYSTIPDIRASTQSADPTVSGLPETYFV